MSDARRGSWERMTGDALYGLGQLEAATMHLRSAVALLGWPMPKRSSEIASSILAKLAQQALHRAVPRPWIEAEPTTAASLLQAARAYARLEQIHYYRGEYLPLFVATLSSLNLSERAGPRRISRFLYERRGGGGHRALPGRRRTTLRWRKPRWKKPTTSKSRATCGLDTACTWPGSRSGIAQWRPASWDRTSPSVWAFGDGGGAHGRSCPGDARLR